MNSNIEGIDQALIKTIGRLEDIRYKQEDITGVPSGFPSLDRITYGWQNTDLIVIASRPSVGKTAFALNLACNAALHPNKPTAVGFFNLETNTIQLTERILSAQSEIWLEKIVRGKLEDYEMKQLYTRGIQRLAQAPIFIDDTAMINIQELKIKCKDLKEQHNIGLIIIDYLQLMAGIGENFNREQDISRITRELKGLAKELQVPIIILSQLNRETERRKDNTKIPQLNDLRDSGAIEQDADIVMFLCRSEYYDISENEMGESNRGETIVRIAKHRNGMLDTIKLKALLHIQKFVEYDEYDFGFNDSFSGSWKPVNDMGDKKGAKVFIKTGSKMNDLKDDEDTPF